MARGRRKTQGHTANKRWLHVSFNLMFVLVLIQFGSITQRPLFRLDCVAIERALSSSNALKTESNSRRMGGRLLKFKLNIVVMHQGWHTWRDKTPSIAQPFGAGSLVSRARRNCGTGSALKRERLRSRWVGEKKTGTMEYVRRNIGRSYSGRSEWLQHF